MAEGLEPTMAGSLVHDIVVEDIMVKKTIAFLVICSVVVLFVIAYPHLYNRYIFPLGKLYEDLGVGQPYGEVKEKFEAYYADHKHNGEIYMEQGVTNRDLMKGPIPETKYLFIYHASIFDDLQLQVLFDSNNKAKEINFIGD